MQWEPGKEYRTRHGMLVVVLEIMPDGLMFGRYQTALGRWHPNAWREDGRDLDGDDDFDLMPPRSPVEVSDAALAAYMAVGDKYGAKYFLTPEDDRRREAIAAAFEVLLAEREAS